MYILYIIIIYKVEHLNIQAPTRPSPFHLEAKLRAVERQLSDVKKQDSALRGSVWAHDSRNSLNAEYMGWLHSSCLFLGLGCSALCQNLSDPVESDQSAHWQSKVCRRPVSWPHVYSSSSIAGWNEDFAAELRAIYRCKQQSRGAERGVDIAAEESGSKGFTNETNSDHIPWQWKMLCSGGDMCQEFRICSAKANFPRSILWISDVSWPMLTLCRQQSRPCWMTWKPWRLRKTRLLEMIWAELRTSISHNLSMDVNGFKCPSPTFSWPKIGANHSIVICHFCTDLHYPILSPYASFGFGCFQLA